VKRAPRRSTLLRLWKYINELIASVEAKLPAARETILLEDGSGRGNRFRIVLSEEPETECRDARCAAFAPLENFQPIDCHLSANWGCVENAQLRACIDDRRA